jgi:hypothetical protein
MTNQLSTSNLIKESNGDPLKRRSRSGGWIYVNALPLLSIQKTFIKDQLDKELEKAVATSLRDSDELLKIRLAKAPRTLIRSNQCPMIFAEILM